MQVLLALYCALSLSPIVMSVYSCMICFSYMLRCDNSGHPAKAANGYIGSAPLKFIAACCMQCDCVKGIVSCSLIRISQYSE